MKPVYQFAEKKQTPFNMAVIFMERLNERLNDRDIASIEGDLIRWYRVLRSIYRNIYFKVKEQGHEEKEAELLKKFEEAENFLSAGNVKDTDLQAQSLTNVEKKLDEIDLILNELIYEYGLLYPKSRNIELEEALDEDFNEE